MKTKVSLTNMPGKLSRSEMKNVMGGNPIIMNECRYLCNHAGNTSYNVWMAIDSCSAFSSNIMGCYPASNCSCSSTGQYN